MLNLWDLISLALIVVFIVRLVGEYLLSLKIRESSERINLRDKGENEGGWICSLCETTVRIGIDSAGDAHLYCWKCESFIDNEDSDDDGGDDGDGEEIPKLDRVVETAKVVNITSRRSKKKVA